MKIKTRLTINFTFLVAGILLISSVSVYFFSLAHRQQDFKLRLKNKALNTATMLINIKDVDARLLKVIDDNTVTSLNEVKVFVLDSAKKLLYSNIDSASVSSELPFFFSLKWIDNNYKINNGRLYLCSIHNYNSQKFFVLSSAKDYFGASELKSLRLILVFVFLFGLVLVIVAGIFNSRQSLRPIKDIIDQVESIKSSNLNCRLETKNQDEIGELAGTFNKMLDRIERAFDIERTFVANASHELRTPVTSIKGQIEVALINPREKEEYREVLLSILDDVQNMANVINGFLDLAQTNIEPGTIKFNDIRIDEILFSAKEEMLRRKANNSINIVFDNIPEDEGDITIAGNERLLKILMMNLFDNACKFSENKRATARISFDEEKVTVKISDNGIGIPAEELKSVFRPLYRAQNAIGKTGSGMGMSIVKRIVEIHAGNIEIDSEVNVGTTVTVSFLSKKMYHMLLKSIPNTSVSYFPKH